MSELPLVDPASVGMCAERLGRLTAALAREIDSGKLPGAVAMISRRGQLAYFEALGRRDPAHEAPMTKDAIFRIYSMTKPIVSVAVMMLVEQGHLLLSDPITRFIPELSTLRVIQGRGPEAQLVPLARPITVHDLLRHTAGLTYHFMGASSIHRQYASERLFTRELSNAAFCEVLAKIPLLGQPGAAWGYSHATDVLGRLVEVVSGNSLGSYLTRHLFEPLGMRETAFHVSSAQHHRIAEPFAVDPDTGSGVSLFDVRERAPQEMGGAGLVSTAADYSRFMQMMLNGGELEGVRLLSPKTVRLMSADHLGPIRQSGEILAPGYGFGLGFAVRLAHGLAPGAGSAGMYYWAGLAGTSFFIDPHEALTAQLLIQQPGRREYYRALFRELVYAALVD